MARRKQDSVSDGQIAITVVGGQHDGKTLHFDAMVVKLAADTLERKHGLKVSQGRIEPTAGFAMDLAKELSLLGYEASPTIAVHAWVKASEYFAAAQKKTSRSRS